MIVFCATAYQAQFVSQYFDACGIRGVNALHSRKTQSYRTRVSNEFRNARAGVLVASDVAARGVDYPGVTLVVQCGCPATREQYVHRSGRTGRAGEEGRALLLLEDFEAPMALEMLAGLPLHDETQGLTDALLSAASSATATDVTATADAASLDETARCRAYTAWLGYHNGNKKNYGWSATDLVAAANHYSREALRLPEPPAMTARAAGMMGLKGVAGVRIAAKTDGGREGGGKGPAGRA